VAKAFEKLGAFHEIHELWRTYAKTLYYDPATVVGKKFGNAVGMASERTDQLFFDIQVNNGGPKESELLTVNVERREDRTRESA
jgi:hypothetical protein